MLERLFGVTAAGSTPAREALGGLTTFLTMAYIIVVNPAILGATGMPVEGAVVATCLAAAFATLVMAVWANYPIALAPGMGLNAFFAFGICLGAGVPWQTALGLVFWAGILFLLLTVTGLRRQIVQAVPTALRLAAAVGIGLFIAFIGLRQGGLVVADPNTLVGLGTVTSAPVLLTLLGLAVTFGLTAAGVRAAIFFGMAVTLGAALLTGVMPLPEAVVGGSLAALPGLEIDLWGALAWRYLPLILVILFFDLFDTLGTLMAVAHEAGFVQEDGEMPRLDRALTADSVGTVAGAFFGTSPVTSYIESGAGVGVGARTGLASVVTAGGFLLALIFTPLAAYLGGGIPGISGQSLNPITAPALIAVGALMIRAVGGIAWRDPTEGIPAFLTALVMPLTFSIAHGLAAGLVAYPVLKIAAGKAREVHPLLYVLAVLLVLRYAVLPG
jgi:AGZA family xanthine/uracil permease-like MFS transporter